MMREAAKICRSFIASTRGVAAIEFAMVLPVLALMFLASFDGGRAVAVYMKLRAATYALAAITNQYPSIASTDMTTILGATSVIMSPYSSTPAAETISQITVHSSTKATVSWSYTQGGTALTAGATITLPTSLYTCASYPCFLVYSQVSYTYTPMFSLFGGSGIALSDSLYVTPRSSTCILYPPGSVSTCPTT
jgi:Flp pilus assembly protein TadG